MYDVDWHYNKFFDEKIESTADKNEFENLRNMPFLEAILEQRKQLKSQFFLILSKI